MSQCNLTQSTLKTSMAPSESGDCLSLLSKFPVEKAEKYLDSVVSSLCGQRGPSFDHCSKVWSLTEFWESNDAWRAFFRSRPLLTALSEGGDAEVLEFLPASHRTVVKKVAENLREDIARHLLDETDAIGGAVLADFDWNVRLVLGSDKVATLGVPLANLTLALSEPGEQKRREVSLEMSLAELERLIAALEVAHKAVVQFKA
ncbi:COMM domain-containing protein 8-like isoform X2 [Amblyomma americanum]